MTALAPAPETRSSVIGAVVLSVICPGLGHWVIAKRTADALLWFFVCQALLFWGFFIAGGTQGDYALSLPFGLRFALPESVNLLGSQFAMSLFPSVENMGRTPDLIPFRTLGNLLSGASGVLACFVAAHAASCVWEKHETLPQGKSLPVQPRTAALLTLVFPGLGHWVQGRRFKAVLFAVSIFGLFILGMSLGDWSDFDRQRHCYYWVGQMFMGLPGWMTSLLCDGNRFTELPPYLDAGLLFTTSAGFFNAIASLDAYHRVEQDGLAMRAEGKS